MGAEELRRIKEMQDKAENDEIDRLQAAIKRELEGPQHKIKNIYINMVEEADNKKIDIDKWRVVEQSEVQLRPYYEARTSPDIMAPIDYISKGKANINVLRHHILLYRIIAVVKNDLLLSLLRSNEKSELEKQSLRSELESLKRKTTMY